jgi:hypothetical protein
MLSGKFKVMGVTHRKGNKGGRDWEIFEVNAMDAGAAPFLMTPLVFNLADQDKDMAARLEGRELTIHVVKVDTFNGKVDMKAVIDRASFEASIKANPPALPTRPQ